MWPGRIRSSDAVPDVDVVVHLAGLVKALTREEFFSVNVEGTRSLAGSRLGRAGEVRPRVVAGGRGAFDARAAAGPRRIVRHR